jgi:FemAB-related protein (PEP-CTERM system-associated)
MRIVVARTEADARLWQDFADHHQGASNYHRWGWKSVIEASFGWPTYYLMAEEGGQTRGILPLVWQKSRLFGSFLTSLPFFNAGGVVAEDKAAEEALIQEGIKLCQQLKARHLELRHRHDHSLGLPAKTNKVAVMMEVGPDKEKMMRTLRHEVRTKIRKAIKLGLTAEVCGAEALNDFYEVFAHTMRDLGTPVYGRNFFEEIFRTFPSDTHIVVVRHQGKAIAASLMSGFRDTIETIWGASLHQYNSMAPNMLMYWKMLCCTLERRYRVFDFGRSTIGSGPHSFKRQWSSHEIPLHWDYWLASGNNLPELNPQNPKYRLAIWLWQRLPLAVTKWIGPRIVKCLP